jgi:mannonate dehydratase
VKGTIPRFQEVFQDEGDYNAVEVMRTLVEVGYDGYVMADHLPGLAVDMKKPTTFLLHGIKTGTRDVAHGWSVGYLRALVQAVQSTVKSK